MADRNLERAKWLAGVGPKPKAVRKGSQKPKKISQQRKLLNSANNRGLSSPLGSTSHVARAAQGRSTTISGGGVRSAAAKKRGMGGGFGGSKQPRDRRGRWK